MSIDSKIILKAISPKMIGRAIRTFDRATVVVVGVCWGAALVMMAFALYAVSLSASTRHAADALAASEPSLPKIVHKAIEEREAKALADQLQRRYPTINIGIGNDQLITITASDGNKFREWLNVLSYIDTISPQYRWSLRELCVGKCIGSALMRAALVGEKISFEAPQVPDK